MPRNRVYSERVLSTTEQGSTKRRKEGMSAMIIWRKKRGREGRRESWKISLPRFSPPPPSCVRMFQHPCVENAYEGWKKTGPWHLSRERKLGRSLRATPTDAVTFSGAKKVQLFLPCPKLGFPLRGSGGPKSVQRKKVCLLSTGKPFWGFGSNFPPVQENNSFYTLSVLQFCVYFPFPAGTVDTTVQLKLLFFSARLLPVSKSVFHMERREERGPSFERRRTGDFAWDPLPPPSTPIQLHSPCPIPRHTRSEILPETQECDPRRGRASSGWAIPEC